MTYNKQIGFIVIVIATLLIITHAKHLEGNVDGTVMMLKQVVEVCREETGASEYDFEGIMKKEPAASMKAKCLRACLMKKFHLMDANGKFNREVALEMTNAYISAKDLEKKQTVAEMIDICDTMIVSTNHCEAAEQYSKCADDPVAARTLTNYNSQHS